MIKFVGVSKFYPPATYALRDINFHIRPGEFVSVVGPSGAGKSTIVKLVIAEERASQGRIIIGGWDISDIRAAEVPILRRQIGVVFQDLNLLPRRTIFENVSFALEVCGISGQKAENIASQVLKIVGLEEKAGHFPDELSVGGQQRACIARALVHRPKILIADEPTGNLDFQNARDIVSLLQKINEFGTTVVLVTHNRDIVNHLKKRVITLKEGMVINDQKEGKYSI